MDNKALRAFGNKHGIKPSTLTGWIKNGPPATIKPLITTILNQELLIEEQAQKIQELENTIKTLSRLITEG